MEQNHSYIVKPAPWENQRAWSRLALMVFFGIIYWLCQYLVYAFALVQAGFILLRGSPSAPLQGYSQRLGLYLKEVLDFLLYQTESQPFPFRDIPTAATGDPANRSADEQQVIEENPD